MIVIATITIRECKIITNRLDCCSGLYLCGGADDHAVVVSDDAMKLFHRKLVLDVCLVTPLLEYIHTHLHK